MKHWSKICSNCGQRGPHTEWIRLVEVVHGMTKIRRTKRCEQCRALLRLQHVHFDMLEA